MPWAAWALPADQAEREEHPAEHVRRDEHHPEGGDHRGDVAVRAKADREAEHRIDEQRPGREGAVGERSTGDDRSPGDRQRTEPVVHTRGGVLGDARGCVHPGPQDGRQQETGDEEVDVVDAVPGVDRAPEDVPEDEEEHRADDRREHEQLRCAEVLQERAPRRLHGGSGKAGARLRHPALRAVCRWSIRWWSWWWTRETAPGAGSGGGGGQAAAESPWSSWSLPEGARACPVRARKTSSSDGRRTPTSSSAMRWSCSFCTTRASLSAPAVDRTPRRAGC